MPSIYDLKPAFQNILRPLTRTLAEMGVTANQVTVAACVMSLATALVIVCMASPLGPKVLWLVPGVLFARMALNAIDGMLAREHGMKSRLGGMLNELTDVISDCAIYLAFAYIPGMRAETVVAVAVLGIISEMTGVVAVTIGSSRRYDGPMGKSDRAIAFSALAVILAIGVSPGPWTDYFLLAVATLLGLTIYNRSRKALTEKP